jgi:hypothetical protein
VAPFKKLKRSRGQALTEMILVVPLLALMLAGTIQLTLLFQAQITFDKVCGDVAREYAAGLINDPSSFGAELWLRLGSYQGSFDKNSISIDCQAPTPTLTDAILQKIDAAGPIAAEVRSYLVNYGGHTWTAHINYIPLFYPSFVFPNGIKFQSQITLLRYPA